MYIYNIYVYYIDIINECALWVNGLWLAWPPDLLPNDLESSVTCVSIRSTECQVRIRNLWSPCHMSKSIHLRLLVDSFPENLSSSPFIIAWKSDINWWLNQRSQRLRQEEQKRRDLPRESTWVAWEKETSNKKHKNLAQQYEVRNIMSICCMFNVLIFSE